MEKGKKKERKRRIKGRRDGERMGIVSFEAEALTEAPLKYLKFSCVRLFRAHP